MKSPVLSVGDNKNSHRESEEDFYSGNDKFHQAPDDGDNKGVRKYSLHSSSNNLKLMSKHKAGGGSTVNNSIFRE